MTREEILAMEPGRELDQLVSEKIMGYPTYNEVSVHAYYNGTTATSFTIFRPSTFIGAAWEVSNRLKTFQLQRKISGSYVVRWGSWTKSTESVECESAPEAICKAALLATLEAQHEAS